MEAAGATGYWDEMTEFLLLMSLLVEIKSCLLLPGDPIEMEEQLSPEEARDQLPPSSFRIQQVQSGVHPPPGVGRSGGERLFREPAAERTRRLRSLEEIVGTGDAMELREAIARLLEQSRP